jgi:hypothetical protein
MILALFNVSGSSAGRVLSTILRDRKRLLRMAFFDHLGKTFFKVRLMDELGKWTDNESARARIQSTDITSTTHHGPSDRE